MTKTRTIRRALAAMLTTALVFGTAAFAQTPPALSSPAPSKAPEKPAIPLKVQVTLSRFDGEKKTASLPFTLWVNANDQQQTSLTVGLQVRVPQSQDTWQYRSVGTGLTCGATSLDDGRFRVSLMIDDSSIAPSKDAGAAPIFQSLSTHNYLLLRDGQNAQFVAATDKVTGEVTKVDVTVTVLK